jgi:CBS domain containing-hemolysin-like protein
MSSVEDDDDVDSEIQMFQNALEFSGVKARDIMSPEPSSWPLNYLTL